MSCITIRIMIATFTSVVADLPLLPRGKFNPALGQIYPRATFTPALCIRGMSFLKFTPGIPLGFVQTSGWCMRPLDSPYLLLSTDDANVKTAVTQVIFSRRSYALLRISMDKLILIGVGSPSILYLQ